MAPGNEDSDNRASTVAGLTRKEFLTLVVQRAAIAGTVLVAPKIIDKFLVPPVYAANSANTTGPPPKHNTDTG